MATILDSNSQSHRSVPRHVLPPVFFGKDGLLVRRSRSLRTRQISAPSSSYFAGSVSFIIWRKSCSRRVLNSARRSDIKAPPGRSVEELNLDWSRRAVTGITNRAFERASMKSQFENEKGRLQFRAAKLCSAGRV